MFTSFSWAQSENSWTKKSSFDGMKREKAVAFSIDSLGYVSCGVDTAEQTLNDLWQYNPSDDSWTQMASIPGSARRNAVAFVAQGKGYVGTGLDLDDGELGQKLKDFWEYDPLGNSWTEKAHYPGGGDTGIYQATGFGLMDKGYVACGKIGSDAYIPELWEYNPTTDEWTERTPFPGGDRYQLISFVLEGRAFVGLGTDHDVFRKDLYEYNPLINAWQVKENFPGTERAQASSFTIGSKGFVVFGTDGGLKDELWEYSFYTESWTSRSSFKGSPRKYGIAFSIGDKGYAGLGKAIDGKKRSFYEYSPTGPLSLLENESIEFSFYPNPLTDQSTIILPNKLSKGKYVLFSLNGVIHRKSTFEQSNFTFDKNDLPQGNYQLVIFDQNNTPLGFKKITVL